MGKLIALGLMVGNVAQLASQLGRDGRLDTSHMVLPLGYTGAYLALWGYLRLREGRILADPILIAALGALTGIGLAALAGIDPHLAFRQLQWLWTGIVVFAATAHGRVWPTVQRYTYVWAVTGLVLLAWPALYGIETGGARSWVALGPLSMQPTEFAKILFVWALASYLADSARLLALHGPRRFENISWRYLGPIILMALLFGLILTLQRDLGAALLLFGLTIALVTVATSNWRYAAWGLFMLGAVGTVAVNAFAHVRTRLVVWLDPWSYMDGPGYQIVESLFALGRGGFLGTGWGRGLASRIPVVESDFIFSLITEEIGLLGATGVLFLLAVVCVRIIAPARWPHLDETQRMGALGLGLLLALQTALIVGGVLRIVPVTGVTLPFVSYGGSSLIAVFIQVGLAYNMQATSAAERRHDRRLALYGT